MGATHPQLFRFLRRLRVRHTGRLYPLFRRLGQSILLFQLTVPLVPLVGSLPTAAARAHNPTMTYRRCRFPIYWLILATLALHAVGLANGWSLAPVYWGRVFSLSGAIWVASAAIPVKYFIKVNTPASDQVTWGRTATGWFCTAIETHTQPTAEFENINSSIAPLLAPHSPVSRMLIEPPAWSIAPRVFTKFDTLRVQYTLREFAIGVPWRFVVRRDCFATATNGQPTEVSLSDRPGEQSPWVFLWWPAAASFAFVFAILCLPWLVWFVFKRLRSVIWRRAGRCLSCGYFRAGLRSDLTPCPECGYSEHPKR